MNPSIPFFRFTFDPDALAGIEECLRSGWLTTGAKVKEFERRFAAALGGDRELHAVALNSCTAALHLALEALGVGRGDRVFVPAMTFAATAEVVRYFDAVPVLVDVDPDTAQIDVDELRSAMHRVAAGDEYPGVTDIGRMAGVVPVHYGGHPCDLDGVRDAAAEYGLPVVEDAAHAFPAGWGGGEVNSEQFTVNRERGIVDRNRHGPDGGSGGRDPLTPPRYRMIGADTSAVTCFSFYANKTITTGEGGMAVTADADLAARMRLMSLHGMNRDAWKRYTASGSWDYELVAPGFKYNMTDIAAALGLSQLAHAEEFRTARERICRRYDEAFARLDEVETVPADPGVLHARHLYAVKLRTEALAIDRARFIEELAARGVACSVHWRPLHMHPYYVGTYGYRPEDFPRAAALWPRLVSLPLFPSMTDGEVAHVVASVEDVVARFRTRGA